MYWVDQTLTNSRERILKCVWPSQAVFERQHIWGRAGGWVFAPEDVHVQVPATWAWYLIICQRDSADAISSRILRWGDDPGLSRWPLSEITSALLRGRQGKIWPQRRQCEDMEQRLQRCGHEPRKTSSPQKLEESKNRFSPVASPEGTSPADTLILITDDLFWTRGFQNYKRI